mmetsp:Transcript_29339/g.97280  ORF Transcript_29339/g.97280 Transcript_29339/m.97280 type:complete len:360 (+) Transcript_29339:858-1937(+)
MRMRRDAAWVPFGASREAGLQLVPLRVDDPGHHVGKQVCLQRRELHQALVLPDRRKVGKATRRVDAVHVAIEHRLEGRRRHLLQPLARRVVPNDGVVARVRRDSVEGVGVHLHVLEPRDERGAGRQRRLELLAQLVVALDRKDLIGLVVETGGLVVPRAVGGDEWDAEQARQVRPERRRVVLVPRHLARWRPLLLRLVFVLLVAGLGVEGAAAAHQDEYLLALAPQQRERGRVVEVSAVTELERVPHAHVGLEARGGHQSLEGSVLDPAHKRELLRAEARGLHHGARAEVKLQRVGLAKALAPFGRMHTWHVANVDSLADASQAAHLHRGTRVVGQHLARRHHILYGRVVVVLRARLLG